MPIRLSLAVPVVAAAAVAAAVATPQAEAIVFGANLEQRPANNPFGCETGGVGEFPPGSGNLIATPSGTPTCTWLANGRVPDFAETLAVPTSGTVRQIQVKVGPVTGPMQVVVYSSLGIFDPNDPTKPPSSACCQVRALSQVFTPGANQITTVPVNLPVITEKVPPAGSNILRGDGLALSVLAPGVPVPAHNTGNYNALAGAPVGGIYTPALGPGDERTSPAGLVGFQVLMRADVTPTGAGGGGDAGDAGDAGGSGGSDVPTKKPGKITLSAKQLGINQRIGQAAIRRLNAVEAKLDGKPAPSATKKSSGGNRIALSAKQLGINQRIYQAGVRRANALEARIEGRAAAEQPSKSGSGKVALSVRQLGINQKIAQAAVRRANALEDRVA